MAMDLFGDAECEQADPVPPRDKGKGKAKERASKTTAPAASAGGDEFTINEAFAGKYEKKKRGEELSKLKDKYGSDYEGSETESEDLSSEDSDAEFLTPEVDAAILRTLAKIKRGDPSIYQATGKVYDEEEVRKAAARSALPSRGSKSSHSKPLLLRDYQRQALIATRGRSSSIASSSSSKAEDPTPAQEAARLRAETKQAFFGDEGAAGSDDEADDLLVPREATQGGSEEEDEAYRKFLVEQVGKQGIEDALRLGGGGSAPEGIEDPEAFLRDYILGRGWMDKKSRSIPKYTEVVGEDNDGDVNKGEEAGPSGANAVDLVDDDEDEEHFERAEAFESKYNFRFEDEGGADLMTHARDAGASVRRQDDSRKLARQAAKERKAEEKKARMEERERLKELKRQEILDKVARIRHSAGDEAFKLEGYDLDEDFDPDAHDRHMTAAFDEAFYQRNEAEDVKPTWEDDLGLDKYGDEDDADAMGVDFEPGGDAYDPLAPTGGKGSKRQKQREKKKSKKKQIVEEALAGDEEGGGAQDALTLEEQKAQLDEDLKEYEEMDFEDMIGDLPTRFKYTQVEPDTFALTPAEILLATDTELNEYVGLKKLAPYRDHRRGIAKESHKRKKKLKELRDKLGGRKWGQEAGEGADGEALQTKKRKRSGGQDAGGGAGGGEKGGPAKKRQGKKERQKAKMAAVGGAAVDRVEPAEPEP